MARPLYRCPVVPEFKGGHPGLWYDKFCDKWSDDWHLKTVGDNDSPKLSWINTLIARVNADKGSSGKLLADYARRLFDLVAGRGGASMVATSQSRFVTGLGRSHPVENGFAWHPTLGAPYLPGSSLKGLTRAWALSEHSRDEVDRILGVPGRTGSVAFLDAVPVKPVTLEADVLTPHYANWDQERLPGDWRSPVPVPFLVTAPGLSMLFGIIPISRSGRDDVATAREWLVSALDEYGAGAKTALGYGQFRVDPKHQFLEVLEQERLRREAMATPEGRWRLKLKGLTEDELLEAVLDNLIKTPLDDPEKRAFVRVVLETGMVTAWRKGKPTNPRTGAGAKKLKEYAKKVRQAAQELGVEIPQ